jgi:hypothetical protein
MQIEGKITHCIHIHHNCKDFTEYKANILQSLDDIKHQYLDIKLTRPRLRILLYNSIVLNNNIFKEVSYGTYEFKDNTVNKELFKFIDECINLLS